MLRHRVYGVIVFMALLACTAKGQWIPAQGLDGANADDIISLDTTVFIGTGNGIFSRYVGSGEWEQKSNIMVQHFTGDANTLFAWNWYYILRSTDHGNTWTRLDTSWEKHAESMCMVDSILFFTDAWYPYRSNDLGATYYSIQNNLPSVQIPHITSGEGSLFIYQLNSPLKLYRSDNLGAGWDSVSSAGLPQNFNMIWSVCKFSNQIWVSTSVGVYRFNDLSQTWTFMDDSLHFSTMKGINGTLYAASTETGFYRWDAGLNHFIPENTGLETLGCNGFSSSGNILLLGTNFGPFKSSMPISWQPIYEGLNQLSIRPLAFNGNKVWVKCDRGIFLSEDNGNTFTAHPISPVPDGLIATDTAMFMIAADSFYVSHDQGQNWQKHIEGFPYTTQWPYLHLYTPAINQDFLFMGSNYGLFRASYNTYLWEKMPSLTTGNLMDIGVKTVDSIVFATKDVLTNNYYYYTFRSMDQGLTFDSIESLGTGYFPMIAGSSEHLYALEAQTLSESIDQGLTWTTLPAGSIQFYGSGVVAANQALVIAGSKLDITIYDLYVIISYDNGSSWNEITDNLPVNNYPWMAGPYSNNQRLFTAPDLNGIWYRDDMLTSSGPGKTKEESSLKIFPNPAGTMVSVTYTGSDIEAAILKIIDGTGKTIIQQELLPNSGQHTINIYLTALPDGLFTVTLFTGNGVQSRRFIHIH
jgi:hypothetical protein